MTPDAVLTRARAVRIEAEVSLRGVNLIPNGKQLSGACPACGGTDRFNVDPYRNLWICRGCREGGDVIKLVRHLDGCSFSEAVKLLTTEERQEHATNTSLLTDLQRIAAQKQRRSKQLATALWAKCKPIEGTLAERYLFWRGITGPLPATLGYLPQHQAHPPAMIAAFGSAQEPGLGVLSPPDNVTGIHITRLTPTGQKVASKPKVMLGTTAGLPIIIAPPNDLCGLAITEGIEDALTVHCATGLGAWAAGSAGFMPKLARVVPSYITSVTIYAHQDKPGQDGARELAAALRARQVRGPERGPQLLCDRISPREALVGWQPTEFYPAERPIDVTIEGIS